MSDLPPLSGDNADEAQDPLYRPHMITSFYGHLKVVDGATYLDMGERGVLKVLETGVLAEYQRGIVAAGVLSPEVELAGQRVLMQMHFLDVRGQDLEEQ